MKNKQNELDTEQSQEENDLKFSVGVSTRKFLTIITPVYNGENFIERCMKTVIEQNCSSVEHLIVDAASTDNTLAIIKQYAEQFPHIRWISEPDRGQSDAMNKGIAIANGKYIGILNVDDYYEAGVLNRALEILQSSPEPSFVAANCNLWDGNDNLIGINKPSHLQLKDLLQGWCVHPFPYNPSAYFYHASLHDKAGFYSLDEYTAMDLDFILRAVQHAKLHYVDEMWGNFVVHENTKTFKSRGDATAIEAVHRIMRHYRKDLGPLHKAYVTFAYEYSSNDTIVAAKQLIKQIFRF